MKKCVAAMLMVMGAGASMASADVLWDQSAFDWNAPAFFNSISGAPPFGVTAYAVADVHVPAGGWTVNSVTMYFSDIESGGSWETAVTQGRLYIQPKTGSSPTVAPGGSLIPMSAVSLFDNTVQQSYYAVTASGLNNILAPGDYWIGITPAAPGGFFGPELGMPTAGIIGSQSSVFDVGFLSWSGVGSDAAILVNGTVPAPASLGLLGMGALCVARRRRA